VTDITRPITELAEGVSAGRVTARQLVQASLDALAAHSDYHAVLETNSCALEAADAIDSRVAAGESVGPLAGVPFIAKDNFLTLGTHTTAASHILESFRAPYQSTAVSRLVAAGAVLVAKANMDAFGHGGSTENSDFGPTKNPVDPTRVPGGSSGGSAAAVALGLCSFAIGTDTGGSNRFPASLCGVVGLKPTYGLVSRYGVVAMASSTDTIGPLTRSVADAALVLDVMAGQDPLDSTTIARQEEPYTSTRKPDKDVRIGLISEYLGEGIDPEVKAAVMASVARFRAAGVSVEEVSLPSLPLSLACYYIIVPAEISSNLSRYDGVKYGYSAPEATTLAETYDLSRSQGFGAEAKRRILIGTYVLSSGYYDAYYKKAQAVRTLLIRDFEKAFEKYDVLIGPTAPMTAFPLGQKAHDPLAMYLADICTVAPSLVGVPAISIPCGLSADGLPIGLQLIAAQGDEHRLFAAAAAAEELLGGRGEVVAT
jgi:aspartyl-tRNA(Asn)/glutamyl-tRNA(Gln) amidotransferase subunit A